MAATYTPCDLCSRKYGTYLPQVKTEEQLEEGEGKIVVALLTNFIHFEGKPTKGFLFTPTHVSKFLSVFCSLVDYNIMVYMSEKAEHVSLLRKIRM